MNEYSRIVIEEYCMTHNTQKSTRLFRLVQMSYDLSAEGSDADACYLESVISREKIQNLNKRYKTWMTTCSGGEIMRHFQVGILFPEVHNKVICRVD